MNRSMELGSLTGDPGMVVMLVAAEWGNNCE
jgi:hypothetical protein